jgi:hypothetical protein
MNVADALADIELQSGDESSVKRYCNCDELVIGGKRQPCPKYHDCMYVLQRSKLVPRAVQFANERVPEVLPFDADGGRSTIAWSCAFGREMERLSAPLLLQQQPTLVDENGSSPANTDQDRQSMTVPLIA